MWLSWSDVHAKEVFYGSKTRRKVLICSDQGSFVTLGKSEKVNIVCIEIVFVSLIDNRSIL